MNKERNFIVDLEFNRKFTTFAKQMHIYTAQFPREQKFSAVKELNDLRDEIHSLAVLAHYKQFKKTTLNELRAKISLLECKIEFFRDLGYFSCKKVLDESEKELQEHHFGWHRAGVLFDLLEPVGERVESLVKFAMKDGKW